MSTMRSILCLFPSSLAFVLGGAHFWRAAQYPFSVGCLLFAILVWRREAWIRQALLVFLPLLAGRWVWTAAQFVQLRMFMEQPWMRLACILLGVSLFTATAALLLEGKTGDAWYARGKEKAFMRTAAFFGAIIILTPLLFVAPQVFLTERFLPGWAPLHILLAGFWASWVASRLGDREAAPRARLFVWRLFSVVFFAQLALGLAGYGLFLMTGNLHLPVPGMILAAPLYRGGGLFMPILFGVSVLLAGAAWCSHLCYFGVWDAVAAAGRKAAPPPRWMPRLRLVSFGLMLAVPVALRLAGVPTGAAVALGLALGLLLLPFAVLLSRRYGSACYCLAVCPLGLAANWLGRIAPWRIRRTDTCTRCLACTRVCRYGALTPDRLQEGRPGPGCTLCRDCLSVCRHDGLAMTLYGKTCGAAESGFVVLLSVMHAVFLAVARV